MVGYAGSTTRTVYVDVTLTRSKVKVNLTGHLNFRQLAKPGMLAAMTAAPLRGFLVYFVTNKLSLSLVTWYHPGHSYDDERFLITAMARVRNDGRLTYCLCALPKDRIVATLFGDCRSENCIVKSS